jgi:DNA repair protein RecN (Recombination protein N)
MLKLLHIENIAVIEKADIEFKPGLNVLTGETGAGKSIVIDALSVVTGGRASRDSIRAGSESASVTAVFSASQELMWFEENGVRQDESGEIFAARKISAEGKSVCRVNGIPVSAAQLRDLGAELLDIHGQNDGRKLLDESAHLSYLDIYGVHANKLEEYKFIYKDLAAKSAEIKKITLDESEKEYRIETLSKQIKEIELANLKPGEYNQLMSRRELLGNAAKLTEAAEGAFVSLYGGENSDGAIAQIISALEMIDSVAHLVDEALSNLSRSLSDLRYCAQDISDELRDFRESLEFSPGELDEIEARLETLRKIERKYGGETEALEFLESAKTELLGIEDSDNTLKKLRAALEAQILQAQQKAAELSKLRKASAKSLQDRVMQELSELSMPGTQFIVEFQKVGGKYALSASGCDEVCFLMSANAGENPGKISRIASGGELARIMLALKNVLGGKMDTGTMVFDEVDTGVSGVAAQRVAEKLAKLAADRQVLCVTHLPQIAVMADTHFEILKTVSSGRTYTNVAELNFEGRQNEIARLSGGENITETTRRSAAEQLTAAGEYKKKLKAET